jgi:hypothetical protein
MDEMTKAREIERMIMDVADAIAGSLEQPADARAWDHLLVYVPREAMERRIAAQPAAPVGAQEPVLSGLQEDLILMGFHNDPAPLEAATPALTGAELGRWCYENPNLAARTIEGLRHAAQAVPSPNRDPAQ